MKEEWEENTMKLSKFKIAGIILLIVLQVIIFISVAAVIFLYRYPGVGKVPDKEEREAFEKITDLYYDGKFHTENDFTLMTGKKGEKSDSVKPQSDIPVVKCSDIKRGKAGDLNVTWLGHSSSFIQMGDQNILMDPVLTMYASPVSFVGVKRFSDIAMSIDDVPEIDVLFISHDHYDHLDYETIKKIDDKVSNYVLPLGVDSYLKGWGIDEGKIHALNWWESIEINGIDYTLTPGQHFTGRNPLESNATLWGGLFCNDAVHTVYYTGDTGYCDIFQRIHDQLGDVDLMLVEDGQYNEAWSQCHMMPEESALAAKEMNAKWTIPVHWGAFVLSTHSWNDSVTRFSQAAKKEGIDFISPKIGETVDFDKIKEFDDKWWETLD